MTVEKRGVNAHPVTASRSVEIGHGRWSKGDRGDDGDGGRGESAEERGEHTSAATASRCSA